MDRVETHDPQAADVRIAEAFDRHGKADTKTALADLSSAIGRAWEDETRGLAADLRRGLEEAIPDDPDRPRDMSAWRERLDWSSAMAEAPDSWRHAGTISKRVEKAGKGIAKRRDAAEAPACLAAYHEALLARAPVYAAVKERFEEVKAALPARMEARAAERREAKERTLDGTGSCGCCSRNVKMDDADRMVDHGFVLEGNARQGGCVGVGLLPFEMSPEGAEAWLDTVNAVVAALKSERERLESGTVAMKGYDHVAREDVPVLPGESGYDRLLTVRKAAVDAEIAGQEREAERTAARIEAWEPAPLPDGRADHLASAPAP